MAENSTLQEQATIDRRGRRADRRVSVRRKKQTASVATERRNGSDRRKAPRRRQIDPTTCERDYTDEEIEFMTAMDRYKRKNNRPFPTWSEVLEVLRALGYERDASQPAADQQD